MRMKIRIDVKAGKGNQDFIKGRITGIMNCIIGFRYTDDGRRIFDYLWYTNKKDATLTYMLCNTTEKKWEQVKTCFVDFGLMKFVEIKEMKKN